ncbi:arsenic transporter [Ectobacillus ponti]|uniref:Arsenic transporter n=1 Tax=Ectobacillus ponti TaxID=2961894 RepID=A0AA42BNG7_9BACI|nr:arsenic transporter [Ectobacillus ponti]MCP8967647.1 arsenic transporter [Ectobacillus ponti]
MSFEIIVPILVFSMTMLVIFWRPKGIHEAWPATIGAIIILLTGTVSGGNLLDIVNKIGGASLTILATIVMAVTLESFGFFHWCAARMVVLAKGSGYRLYWLIQLLCFLMTILFNNDGSILITTHILILLLRNLQLKPHQQIPYLLPGALIATASSAPIGVSNIVNLISLNIVHMTLYMHTLMIFVPAMLGLLFMSSLMYIVVKPRLTKHLPNSTSDMEHLFFTKNFHPLKGNLSTGTKRKRTRFMLRILLFVLSMRALLFVASYFAIPIEIVAIIGSLVLLLWRWYYLGATPADLLKKTPWQILVFAFSMYVIIYGLHNTGLTDLLVSICQPIVTQGLFHASLMMGGLIAVMSNLFNNHPALMIGTLTLTEMQLDPLTLKTIYLANIIGSDMGSLLLPIGTLASLIWMHILRQYKIRIKWKDYLRVSLIVVPLTTIFTLLCLFYWIELIFSK